MSETATVVDFERRAEAAKEARRRGKTMAVLSGWRLERLGGHWRLAGEVAQHDEHPDGTQVVTSALLWLDFARGMAETRNTLYMLGKPGG